MNQGIFINSKCRKRWSSIISERLKPFIVFSVLIGLASIARANPLGDDSKAEKAIAVLKANCFSCHDSKKQEGGLRLDSRDWLLKGGDHGDVYSPNAPGESLLMRCVDGREEGMQMPPKNPLRSDQILQLLDWLESGAVWPLEEVLQNKMRVESTAAVEFGKAWEDDRNPITRIFHGERLDLWSLQPIRSSTPPKTDPASSWPFNPIDSFLMADWQNRNQTPAPDVDRRTLARRIHFDLTGLPPTFDQMRDFLAAIDRPGGFERYVDKLLGADDYGRHMGRFWLDVVRYSDSNGFDWDEFRPQAWRFRDYVVRAWNQDIGFDRFIEEQLAGDELLSGAPKNTREQDTLLATGYLRMGPHDNAASLFNEQDRSRAELLADLTETTSSAFLGLTMSCCRCHDHKTEPLSQEDHYRLRAFFGSVKFADDIAIDLEAEQLEINAHNAPIDEKIAAIDAQLEKLDKKSSQHKALSKEKEELGKSRRQFTHGFAMTDSAEHTPIHVFYQGDHKAPRQEVSFGFPSVLGTGPLKIQGDQREGISGKRRLLARWIASPENPWTARVIVNRLWQSAFGEGLVSTPNDFGLSGSMPEHAELLDWLAAELIRSDWSLKHIHRLIVTSHAYKQRSVISIQSENGKHFASVRRGIRRLSAEQWRDATLQASGLMTNIAGGKPVWPELPEDVLQANPAFLDDNETKTKGWYASPKDQQFVRSIYLVQKRTVKIPMLETFDLPDNTVSCARRENSLVAPQALTQLNGSLTLEASAYLEARCRSTKAAERIEFLYHEVLQRSPNAEELKIGTNFLTKHSVMEFARVLLNTNEFLFVE